ncbi:MAG: VanZ family protein [Caldilineales bacterium]|nr:VanZ family protein [Caldilineales bacterium]
MKVLTVLFVLFLAFVVLAADKGYAGQLFGVLYGFPGGDKVGHFLLMGTLSFLVNFTLRARTIRLGKVDILLGTLIVLAIVTLEEFTQILMDNRSFSLIDLTFDYAGIILFGYAAARLARRNQPSPV